MPPNKFIPVLLRLLLTTYSFCFASFCYTQDRKQIFKDSVQIKNWFYSTIKILKDTTADNYVELKPFVSQKYSVVLLPQKNKINSISLGNYYHDYNYDMMADKTVYNLWNLLGNDTLKTGFIYPNLKDTILTVVKSKEDTVITKKITWYAVVIYGREKRLTLPSGGNPLGILFGAKKSSRSIPTPVLGYERHYDSIVKRDIYYIFVPKFIEKTKGFDIEIGDQGGDVEDYHGPGWYSIESTKAATWIPITIQSLPKGCTIYRVPVSEYILEDSFFTELEKSIDSISQEQINRLDRDYLLADGQTDITIPMKEIAYYIHIRKGNRLSPRILLRPEAKGSKTVFYDFKK